MQSPPPAAVAPPKPGIHPIDAFIRDRLEKEKLQPQPGADRATLARWRREARGGDELQVHLALLASNPQASQLQLPLALQQSAAGCKEREERTC